MAEGLIPDAGLRGGVTLAMWGVQMLDGWASRRWWPTERLRGALPLRLVGFTANESRPQVTFNRGACTLRFALEQTNQSPYHIDWLSAGVDVSVEEILVASFEIGARGRAKAGGVLAFRVEHAMTPYQMSRLRFALEQAKKEQRAGSPATRLSINRLYRTRHDDHQDDAAVILDVNAHVLGDEAV